ncbi:MAG: hypothetical protein RRY08_04925, partial [Christensenella sp.]
MSPLEFDTQEAVRQPRGKFITDDEITTFFKDFIHVDGNKYAAYIFFRKEKSMQERIKFLKNAFGTGGGTHALSGADDSWQEHSSAGITLMRGDITSPYDKVQISWPNASKYISDLIEADQYLSAEEKAHMPIYIEKQEQQNLKREEEQLLREAERRVAEQEKTRRQTVHYDYSIGDEVIISMGTHTVLNVAYETVTVNDEKYPLLTKDIPRDEFERQLRQYTQNDYLMTGETTVSPLHESELVQEDAVLDLQLGTIIKWDEHTFKIESIEYVSGDVTMRDITFENKVGFPINRVEKIEVVRDKIIAQNKTAEESEQMPVQKSNYQITNDELGYGSKKEKYLNNITAIKTLQVIESEARWATPKEQEVLARYVGWGGLAEAFEGAVKISDFANNSTVRLSKEDEATPKSDLMKATANILNKDNWAKKCAELKELLSESEYRLACESVLNAHYTSPTVIRAMYDCIANMGFKSGNILEPSCGIGNFFGMLPESMKQSKLYGIELDSITGRIAKQLYQNADIAVQGFEQTNLPDSFFDLAIGNVPFGDYG